MAHLFYRKTERTSTRACWILDRFSESKDLSLHGRNVCNIWKSDIPSLRSDKNVCVCVILRISIYLYSHLY